MMVVVVQDANCGKCDKSQNISFVELFAAVDCFHIRFVWCCLAFLIKSSINQFINILSVVDTISTKSQLLVLVV